MISSHRKQSVSTGTSTAEVTALPGWAVSVFSESPVHWYFMVTGVLANGAAAGPVTSLVTLILPRILLYSLVMVTALMPVFVVSSTRWLGC